MYNMLYTSGTGNMADGRRVGILRIHDYKETTENLGYYYLLFVAAAEDDDTLGSHVLIRRHIHRRNINE